MYMYSMYSLTCTVNSVLSGHSKRRPKICFQDRLSFNAGQKYWGLRTLRSLFCLFLSGRLRQLGFTVYHFEVKTRVLRDMGRDLAGI